MINKNIIICIIAELTDLEKLQKQVEELENKYENLKVFIRFNNNDIADILSNTKGISFETFRALLNNYYYMLGDDGESTQDALLDKGYFKDEDGNYQAKYEEYKNNFEDWVTRQRELEKQKQVLKGGKTRKNRKPRK